VSDLEITELPHAKPLLPENQNWIEKYRPQTIEACVLTQKAKMLLTRLSKAENIPNIMLVGDYGVGKTTLARLLAISIMKGKEDVWQLHNHFERFTMASAAKQTGELLERLTPTRLWNDIRLLWVLDEFDKLSLDYQIRFLGVLEEETHRNGFILTANDLSAVHRGIQDRCTILTIDLQNNEEEIKPQMVKLGELILNTEKVAFKTCDLQSLVENQWFAPRSFVADLQTYSIGGELIIL
tara:strand:+ start:2020 stop:2736 length:717 start_codon:yes stop_codon:yes gene_type:complete